MSACMEYSNARDVYLEIPKLGELLATSFETADERFDLFMNNFVCTHISPLGESFATDIA